MKVLFFLSILWCSSNSLWASDFRFDFQKFKKLSYGQKVEVIKTYQKLAAKVDENSKKYMKFKYTLNQREEFMRDIETYARLTSQFFLSHAYAQNFNVDKKCAFAGWVADYDKKGICHLTSIKTSSNKNYSMSACSSRQIQCNPMLFGKNGTKSFCVDAYSPGNRGASYQCMLASSAVPDQKKHMNDIIANIMGDPESFHQLVLVLQRLCLCESEEAKGKNKYRNLIHTANQNTTCIGLLKQLKALLNFKNDGAEKLPWFCAEASFSQNSIQKDLSGIKAIVDKLEDEKKYDETLKTVCAPAESGGGSPPILNEEPADGTSSGNTPAIEVVCTDDGECTDPPAPVTTTSPAATGLTLVATEKVDGNDIEIQITELVCNSMKTPKTYVEGNEGCTLTWKADPASETLELDNGVLWQSIAKATTEFAITITLSDGKTKVVSTHTIPVAEKSSTTSDDAITSDSAITSDDAIDFGSDTVPSSPPPNFINLGAPFMFLMPGMQ